MCDIIIIVLKQFWHFNFMALTSWRNYKETGSRQHSPQPQASSHRYSTITITNASPPHTLHPTEKTIQGEMCNRLTCNAGSVKSHNILTLEQSLDTATPSWTQQTILCVLDRASSWYLNKGWPTRWHLLYYILLNMFQTLICPSSGVSEYLLCWVVVQPTLGYHITNRQSRYITPARLKSAYTTQQVLASSWRWTY